MESYKIDFASLPWVAPIPGMRCKAHRHDGRQLRLVEYTHTMEPHWCERGHVGYVLDGQLEIRYDEQTLVYAAGDGVFIPSGAAHRHMARVLSDTVRVIFVEDV
jgi:ethanolamine utilization protein EutQ (cupin superfamily)